MPLYYKKVPVAHDQNRCAVPMCTKQSHFVDCFIIRFLSESTVVNTNGTSIQVQNQPVHAAGGVITVSGGQVFTTPNTSPVISTAPSNQVVFANNPANYTNQQASVVNPPIINANPIQARTPARFQQPSAGQRIAAGMTRAIVSGAVQGAMQGLI